MKEKKYVLLIDDEPDFLETISFWLKSKGHNVKTASSGQEALKIIEQDEPRLVFLDLNMPDMDGIQVLREIRKRSETLPVIMVSAYCADPRMKDANTLKISGMFPKNGTFDQLGNVLEVTLRTYKGV